MTPAKQQYLDSIRQSSAYPTYRGVIGLIAFLFYAVSGVSALGALIGGLGAMTRSFMTGLGTLVMGLLFAAIFFLMAKFYKEAALILADIGDSIVDSNSRTRQGFSAGAD
jgi:hypothetical protein